MNAEIVAALETFYPEEPTVEEVLDRVHEAIELAQNASKIPYRKLLIDALDQLSDRIIDGMEPDQFRAPPIVADVKWGMDYIARQRRWKRAQLHGVETQDFERELHRGMLAQIAGDRVLQYINWIDAGLGDRALHSLGLAETKFVDKDAALNALRNALEKIYRQKWGDPDEQPPRSADDYY
jgi:hypothetical protein